MQKIEEGTLERIDRLRKRGDSIAGLGGLERAIGLYKQAYSQIPIPRNQREVTTRVLIGLGDACFRSGRFELAQKTFAFALDCPGGRQNPFVHLRLGQCALECGDPKLAAAELAIAHENSGDEIFVNENRKYLRFLKAGARN